MIRKKSKNTVAFILMFIPILLSYIILFFLFEYPDVLSITAWSYNVLDLTFQGRIVDLYSYCLENPWGGAHTFWGGNPLWLIPLAVWNFPSWLVSKYVIGGFTIPIGAILWTKLLLLLCTCLTGYLSWRILKFVAPQVGRVQGIRMVLLLLGSGEILLSTMYSGQDEIVYVAFYVWALYYLMVKNSELGYTICALISVSICPIMLLPHVAIVLMRQKKLICLVRDCVVPIVPAVLIGFVYRNDETYQRFNLPASYWIGGMFSNERIILPEISASVLGVLIAILLFVCYFEVHMDEYVYGNNDESRKVIWILAIIMTMFNVLAENNFYRFFIYIPFLLLAIFSSKDGNRNVLLFLFMIFQGCRLTQCIFTGVPNVLNSAFISRRGVSGLFQRLLMSSKMEVKNGDLAELIVMSKPGFPELMPIIGAAMLFSAIGIFFITSEHNKKKYDLNVGENISSIICSWYMLIVLALFFHFIIR